MDALEMSYQLRDIVKSARFIYGDRWKERAKEFREDLAKHQKATGKATMLAAAIDYVKDLEGKAQLAYLAAAADPELSDL